VLPSLACIVSHDTLNAVSSTYLTFPLLNRPPPTHTVAGSESSPHYWPHTSPAPPRPQTWPSRTRAPAHAAVPGGCLLPVACRGCRCLGLRMQPKRSRACKFYRSHPGSLQLGCVCGVSIANSLTKLQYQHRLPTPVRVVHTHGTQLHGTQLRGTLLTRLPSRRLAPLENCNTVVHRNNVQQDVHQPQTNKHGNAHRSSHDLRQADSTTD
jgi:hypothetical protein